MMRKQISEEARLHNQTTPIIGYIAVRREPF